MRKLWVTISLILLPGIVAADAPVDYLRDVKPILEKRCFACHGALKQEAELRVDTGALIRKGGAGGPSVEAGDVAGSLLIERVSTDDPALRMPQEGAALTAEEIAKLSAWIKAGAKSPDNERPQEDPRAHWAFRKPVRAAVPHVKSEWVSNPIDAFIAAGHIARGVEALPEADKPTLLRRVYVDLIGLPPTRDELRAFLADSSDTAYESVVDRLLESPRYGERWGRHWMDVWRYSDWYGRRAVPDVMYSYPQIWRWRDWIVDSLNADKGYDRMVVEMVAADEAAPGDDANVVATGFVVRNWFKWNYENWMKDNVEHTSKAFLGMTLNCAHCHNHKYDPITQEEYFRFRAFFEPLELRQDRVPGLPDPGPFQKYVYAKSYGPITAGLIRVFDEKADAQTFMYTKGDSRNRMEGKPPVEPGVPAVLGNEGFGITPVDVPAEAYYPGLKQFVRDEERSRRQAEMTAAQQTLGKSQESLAVAEKRLVELRAAAEQPVKTSDGPSAAVLVQAEQALLDARLTFRVDDLNVTLAAARVASLSTRIAADDAKYRGLGDLSALAQGAFQAEKQADYEEAQLKLARAERSLIVVERKAASDVKAKPEVDKAQKELTDARAAADTVRGALATTGENYTPISPVYPPKSTGRRLALANWIANSKNPLTARVAVNHIWMRHFGRGLVETPSNFGRNGRPPSHPELLDWLAVELMERGWKMKPLHRLIVTSRTYRLRSNLGAVDHPNLAKDRDNQLYWRANPRRMEAEAVRDGILACAEELDATAGGEELDPAQGLSSRRRSLYFSSHGEGKMQFLELFDGPDVADCYERITSVRPQQALALMNSDLPLSQSRILAEKLWSRTAALDFEPARREADFVRAAFEQILSRPATEPEVQASLEFLTEQTQAAATASPPEPLAPAAPEVTTPAAAIPAAAGEPAQRARETLIHALFSHNDFVTVR